MDWIGGLDLDLNPGFLWSVNRTPPRGSTSNHKTKPPNRGQVTTGLMAARIWGCWLEAKHPTQLDKLRQTLTTKSERSVFPPGDVSGTPYLDVNAHQASVASGMPTYAWDRGWHAMLTLPFEGPDGFLFQTPLKP